MGEHRRNPADRPIGKFPLTFDGFHDALGEAWKHVQHEWEAPLLNHESDVQASVYHHLRQAYRIEPTGFQIWSELKGRSGRRPDLAVQLGTPGPWIVLEFKWLFGGKVRWAKKDVAVNLREDREYPDDGPTRAYFCFVAEANDPGVTDRVRKGLDELADWARGRDFLFFAEGFFIDQGKEKPRPAREPWAIRPAGTQKEHIPL